jgi:hypothetical protein
MSAVNVPNQQVIVVSNSVRPPWTRWNDDKLSNLKSNSPTNQNRSQASLALCLIISCHFRLRCSFTISVLSSAVVTLLSLILALFPGKGDDAVRMDNRCASRPGIYACAAIESGPNQYIPSVLFVSRSTISVGGCSSSPTTLSSSYQVAFAKPSQGKAAAWH